MDDDRYVPGTVHLVDLEGVLDAKHASGSQIDIVLCHLPPPIQMIRSAGLQGESCCRPLVCVCASPRHCIQVQRSSIDDLNQLHTVHRHCLGGNIFCSRAYSRRHGFDSG